MPSNQARNAVHALTIDRAADMQVMLYNYPGCTGVMMGETFLSRVGRSKNLQAVKESSGDINRVHLLARDYPHIEMSCSMDDQALEFFAWGSKSWVCGGSNFLPKEHVRHGPQVSGDWRNRDGLLEHSGKHEGLSPGKTQQKGELPCLTA
jgi:dihydrodipicolinate synthase/N-acetylneuraminate lyase